MNEYIIRVGGVYECLNRLYGKLGSMYVVLGFLTSLPSGQHLVLVEPIGAGEGHSGMFSCTHNFFVSNYRPHEECGCVEAEVCISSRG